MARRDAVRIATRVTTGIVGVAVLGVVVTGALLLPPAAGDASAPSVLVTPVVTDQQRVCPGSLLRPPAADATSSTTAVAVGSAAVTSGSPRPGRRVPRRPSAPRASRPPRCRAGRRARRPCSPWRAP